MIRSVDSLKDAGLRDTQPRRAVLLALKKALRPLSVKALGFSLRKAGTAVNTVTLYRMLDVFEKKRIVHKHPCEAVYSLCTLPDDDGHHGFLHCSSCGKVEEYSSGDLCKIESRIAKSARFTPSEHVSEIIGTCHSCIS